MAIDSAASLLFKIGANTDDASENIARFRTLFSTNLSQIKGQFHNFASQILGDGEKIKASWTGIVAAIAAAGAAMGAGLFETARKTAELGEQLENLHQQTGLSVEMLSALRVRSQEMGIGFDQVAITVETLARNLSPYVRQTSMAARAAHDLGISATDSSGRMKTMDQMLLDTMDAMHKVGVGSKATAAAVSFLSTSGAKMIPIFMGGSAAMKDAAARAQAMGQMFTEVSAAQDSKFLESFRDIKYTVEGLGVTIGQKVMPYITEAMQNAASFLIAHSGAIADAITFLGSTFGDLMVIAEKTFDSLEAFGDALQTVAVIAFQAVELMTDALHRNFGAAKQDFAAMKEAMSEGWAKIKGEFRDGAAGAGDAMAALGKVMEAMTKPAAAGAAAVDKLGQSLEQAREQLQQMQDQTSKPEAAIENQFLRAKEAAERELAGYRKLAAAGKVTREQLGQYEREYSQLVETLGAERAAKLKQLDQKRIASVEQLDQSLANELDSYSTESYAKQKAAIAKQIDAEREKYRKLGALDQQHEAMIEQLRTDMMAKLDKQESDAAARREQQFESEFGRLKAISDQYYQASLSGKEKIQYEYDQEIAKIKQLEAELLKSAQTEQQRQQVTLQAEQAMASAYQREQTQIKALADKHHAATQQWRQDLMSLQQAGQQFGKGYTKIINDLIKALELESAAHKATAAGAKQASSEQAAAEGAGVAKVSLWKGAKEFAEGLASLAAWDFGGAAKHFNASGAFLSVAASIGAGVAAMFSGGGGGGGGGRGGARASSRGSAGGSHSSSGSAGGGSSSQPQPQVNVYVEGGIISADTLNQVVSQISQSVQNGQTTLPATHLIVGGAMVPAGAH